MKRTSFLAIAAAGLAWPGSAAPAGAAPTHLTIYRDTGCGCCEGWAAALKGAGYLVEIVELERAERLRRFAIPADLASCHTALAGRYLVEGHVPLAAIAKLLRERPKTRGIALPGMQTGTPGMPGPSGPVRVVSLDSPYGLYYAE